jgi:hypothetical protein
MGIEPAVGADTFPKQGDWVGRTVRVCFNYDSSTEIDGVIVRQDIEEPGRMIIALSNGRYVLSTECMYGFPVGEKAGETPERKVN